MSPATGAVTLATFAAIVGAEVPDDLDGDALVDVRRTATHSAMVEVGAPFFALRGRRDGRQFVPEALAHGAVCAVVSADDDVPPGALVVDDALAALHRLAAWHRARLSGRVIAVIGSEGKTTTKDALVTFLGRRRRVFGSPGSFNSQIGVPLTVLRGPLEAEDLVIEVAATAPGEMSRLRTVVAPDHVVLTNFGERHRSGFASDAERAGELMAMAADLPEGGWLLAESLPEVVRAALPRGTTVLDRDRVAWPEIHPDPDQHRQRLRFDDGPDLVVESPLHLLATDIALAATAARRLGVTDLPLTYRPSAPATKVWRTPSDTLVLRGAVVDDPVAWTAFLRDAAAAVRPEGRCVLVVTDPLDGIGTDTLQASLTGPEAAAVEELWCVEALRPLLPVGAPRVRGFPHEHDLAHALRTELHHDDVIAILGPRTLDLEAVSPSLLDAMAPSRLYIDGAAIEANVTALRRALGPATAIMAVIKGEAYGTEPTSMARLLERIGIDHFAVATVDEGVTLRRSGTGSPILVLLPSIEELAKAARHGLTLAIQSHEFLEAVLALGPDAPPVHLDVDTGMHRTGLAPSDAKVALERLRAAAVPVEGVMTHLASADEPAQDDRTRDQLARFADVCDHAAGLGLSLARHALNTAGAIRFPEHRFEFARVGIGLVGVPPSPECGAVALQPALSLVTEIVSTRALEPGDRVGYGGDFVAPEPMRVAVIPLGYHDGIARRFTRGGRVSVDGVLCPVVGRVNMDSTVIDITGTDAEVGSTVLVFGRLDGHSHPITEVAAVTDTIPYEVLCRVGPRVQRVFVDY